MTARLLPLYLEADSPPESFSRQLDELVRLSGDLAEWLPATGIRQAAGTDTGADAAIVPDMSGLHIGSGMSSPRSGCRSSW